jgi:hypothetical protein
VPDTRLDEYDQLEWWEVARLINPAMAWEDFARDWDEFVRNLRILHDCHMLH